MKQKKKRIYLGIAFFVFTLVTLTVVLAEVYGPLGLATRVFGVIALFSGALAGLAIGRVETLLRLPKPPEHVFEDPSPISCLTAQGLGARRSIRAEELAKRAGLTDPPYARFEGLDDQLDELLASQLTQFILVEGHAGAGKSRMLFESLKRHLPDSLLVQPLPDQPQAIEDLLGSKAFFAGEQEPIVVWMDQFEEFVGEGGFRRAHLDRSSVTKPRYLFIATIRSEAMDELLRGGSGVAGLDKGLLRGLRKDGDPFRSRLELTEDTKLDPDDENAKVYSSLVMDAGLGVALVQRDVYLEHYSRNRGLDPLVRAVVRAAVDLRRIGMTGPFSSELLGAASKAQERSGAFQDQTSIDEAMVAANEPLDGQADLRLLFAVDDGLWRVDDLLLDIDSGRAGEPSRPVAGDTLRIAIEHASPEDLVRIGSTAYASGNKVESIRAFKRAADSQHEAAAAAMVNLGVLYAVGVFNAEQDNVEQADIENAISFFEQAIESGHKEYGPRAMVNLGVLYAEQDNVEQADIENAISFFEQTAESGHADYGPQAMVYLGHLYEKQGNIDSAVSSFEQAIESGHKEHGPRAMVNLGVLFEKQDNREQDNIDKAITSYKQAIKSGHKEYGPQAMVNLGLLYMEQSEAKAAISSFEQAAESGHADYGPQAMFYLGLLHEEQDNIDKAITSHKQAIESEHADYGPQAMVNLGLLYEKQGNSDKAITYYKQAIESGHKAAMTRARERLAILSP